VIFPFLWIERSRLHSGINYGEREENVTETNIKFPSERLQSANSSLILNDSDTNATDDVAKSSARIRKPPILTRSSTKIIDNRSILREAKNLLRRSQRAQTTGSKSRTIQFEKPSPLLNQKRFLFGKSTTNVTNQFNEWSNQTEFNSSGILKLFRFRCNFGQIRSLNEIWLILEIVDLNLLETGFNIFLLYW